MDYEVTALDGKLYDRQEGLTIPWPLPGTRASDPQNETRVKITFEISGNGLPEDEKVVIVTSELLLKNPGDLKIDALVDPAEDTDFLADDIVIAKVNGNRYVQMVLSPALVQGPMAWEIELPDSIKRPIEDPHD